MKTEKILGFMGLIPFILSFLLSFQAPIMGIDSKQIFITYSAIILSFLAGTLWKNGQSNKQQSQAKMVSNIFCLLAFLGLLLSSVIALIVLAVTYLMLFVYELTLTRDDNKQNGLTDYLIMRLQLSVFVILLHITAFIIW